MNLYFSNLIFDSVLYKIFYYVFNSIFSIVSIKWWTDIFYLHKPLHYSFSSFASANILIF